MKTGEFAVVGKLVMADVRRRPGRLLLTVLSTIAAACVVVWVVSGYDSLVQKFKELSEKYLGRYELLVLPVGTEEGRPPPLPQAWIDSLRQDPAVAVVDPVFQSRVTIKNKANPEQVAPARRFGPPGENAAAADSPVRRMTAGPAPTPTLVGTDAAEPPYSLVRGRWIDSKQPDRMEAAISKGLADQVGVKLDDEVIVTSGRPGEEFSLKIVGIVSQRTAVPSATFMVGLPPSRSAAPLAHGPAVLALYVPWTLAEKVAGVPAKIDFAGVVLAKGIKVGEFRPNGRNASSRRLPRIEFQAQEDVGAQLDQSWTSETIRGQAFSATGISLLAALFIIFTTLNMGVDERVRQFAMLRAVVADQGSDRRHDRGRKHLPGTGWLGRRPVGGLGSAGNHEPPAARFLPNRRVAGVLVHRAVGHLCAGRSLAASVIPAWRATRVSPLEAMVVRPPVRSARLSWGLTAIGLALICLQPLVVFWLPMPDKARYAVSATRGLPGHGNRIHPARAPDRRVHGQVLRADHRAAAGVQLAAVGHATYQQPLANCGNHRGPDHRPRPVRRYANMGLFDAGALHAGRLGAGQVVGLTPVGVPDSEIKRFAT